MRFAAYAISTLLLGQFSASAVTTHAQGNFFLGFREADNTVSDYAINLGPASVYRDATAPIVLSLGTAFDNDMIAAFGADWKTDTDLFWGAVGANANSGAVLGDPGRTLYLSEPTGSNPIAGLSSNTAVTNKVNDFKNDWLLQTETSVANSSIGAPSDLNSWSTNVNNSFGASIAFSPIQGSIDGMLDFYRLPQTASGPSTLLGTFTLNEATNTITFNPVPEPSTAMLLLSSTVAVAGFLRRRNRAV